MRSRVTFAMIEAAAIDLARRGDDHAHARRARQDGLVQLLTLGEGAGLRVVELCERCAHTALQSAVVEQHAGRDERARECSPPRLVGAGDERHPESAVMPQQAVTGPEELALGALSDGHCHAAERSAPAPGPEARGTHPSRPAQPRDQKKRMRSGGHTRPKARPISWLRGTGPQTRESSDCARLSPITK